MNDIWLQYFSKGFIPGSRASFLLDFIVIAIFILLLLQSASIYLVRTKAQFRSHQRIQQLLAAVLLATIILFELEMRIWGWTYRAESSPYFNTVVFPALYIHIACATACFVLWTITLVLALRGFAGSPNLATSKYRSRHRKIARPAALSLYCACITGWIFYWLAFIA